jgi:threonyl-tRNA synthetase
MLQRIYGTALQKGGLDELSCRLEEAKKRDHRSWAANWISLPFLTKARVSFFFPREWCSATSGQVLAREHVKAGYEEIRTPLILTEVIWAPERALGPLQGKLYFTKIVGGITRSSR